MARGSGAGHLFVAAAFAAAPSTACVHRTHAEEIVVTQSPGAASVRVDPPARVRERRPASETTVLEYESRGMARAPFVIGGIVAMLGGMAVTGGGVIAAGLDSDSSFTGDPVAGEGGLDPYVVGALVGGMLPMVGGSALLAYGAGHEHTVEPRTYTFDVEAPGYAPLRREVTVPTRPTLGSSSTRAVVNGDRGAGWTPGAQDREPRRQRSPRFFSSRHRADRAKSAAAGRALRGIHIEHLRQGYHEPEVFDLALSARPAIPLLRVVFRAEPSPRDPVPVRTAAILLSIISIDDRPLHRLGNHLPPGADASARTPRRTNVKRGRAAPTIGQGDGAQLGVSSDGATRLSRAMGAAGATRPQGAEVGHRVALRRRLHEALAAGRPVQAAHLLGRPRRDEAFGCVERLEPAALRIRQVDGLDETKSLEVSGLVSPSTPKQLQQRLRSEPRVLSGRSPVVQVIAVASRVGREVERGATREVAIDRPLACELPSDLRWKLGQRHS